MNRRHSRAYRPERHQEPASVPVGAVAAKAAPKKKAPAKKPAARGKK